MRRQHNLVETTLGADLSDVATSITFATPLTEGGVNIATIVAPDVIPLTIGDLPSTKEVVHLTAYTTGATSGTITREPAGEDTNAVAHTAGEAIRHAPTKLDFTSASSKLSVVVAADDSAAADKSAADYICDGVNDEATIAAAITEAKTRSHVVEFAAGNYYFDAALTLTSTNDIVLRGTATEPMTRGIGDPRTNVAFTKNTTGNFSMFRLAGNNARLALENISIDYVTSESISAPAIDMVNSGTQLTMVRSVIRYVGIGAGAISPGDLSVIKLVDCYIETDGACINGNLEDIELTAVDCYFDSRVAQLIFSMTSMSNVTILLDRCDVYGNFSIDGTNIGSVTLRDCYVGEYGGDHAISDIPQVVVTGCDFHDAGQNNALKITNADRGIVSGNTIKGAGQHGIWLVDCDNVIVEGNVIQDVGTDTDATYSGIILDGDTNDCLVQGNRIATDGAGNLPLYGIRIDDSTCDNNTITNNAVRTSSKTLGNEISDLGTNTQGHEVLMFALGDETTAIAATGEKLSVRWPFNYVVSRLRASLRTASATLGPFTIDVEEGGVSIMTTDLLEIDDTELTSVTALVQPNITDRYIANDAVVTFDVDNVGDGTATGAKVAVYGWRI